MKDEFDGIVAAFRKTLDPKVDEWDTAYTKRASAVLADNNEERAKDYERYEREHQDN